jgi:uncharacterized membrane protein
MSVSKITETIRRDFSTYTAAERHALISALHPHVKARNVYEIDDQVRGRGDRIADAVTARLGSWPFIIVQSILLLCWIALNAIGWIHHWDPYPFILLNLALSFQAAYSAPVIMMSQNRQANKDRIAAANDFSVNVHAEAEIAVLRARLDELSGRQWEALVAMQHQQLTMLEAIHALQQRTAAM